MMSLTSAAVLVALEMSAQSAAFSLVMGSHQHTFDCSTISACI